METVNSKAADNCLSWLLRCDMFTATAELHKEGTQMLKYQAVYWDSLQLPLQITAK